MNHKPFKIYIGPIAEAVIYDAIFCKFSEITNEIDQAGVYVIYHHARAIYVGTSENLGERIKNQPILREMSEKGADCTVHLLLIEGPIERKTVEACLVGLLKPHRNRMQRARIC